MPEFGDRVRHLREARGLTQAELGRQCGMTQTAIANIENGHRSGSRNTAKLAAALGCDPYYLETGERRGGPVLTDDALRIAHLFNSLPVDEKHRLMRIIEAAVGPAVPDEEVERRMPITKRPRTL